MPYQIVLMDTVKMKRVVLVDADSEDEALDMESCGDVVEELENEVVDVVDTTVLEVNQLS